MPVSSQHPQYNQQLQRWNLVRKIIRNDAHCYIRTVDKNDRARSDQYRADAILTNFTKLTRDGLAGLAFKKAPTVNLPDSVDYIEYDATGENQPLEHLAVQTLHEVLETGRYGLFVDYPKSTPDLSAADKERIGLYARIKAYNSESIINWQYTQIGSKNVLSLVVLKEETDTLGEDGFEWVCKTQYRVLYLDSDMTYVQALYNEKEELIETDYPTDVNGKVWKEIPFQFVGAKCNDADVDEIPLYDLAILNLGHYRNSADYEESVFITGQPYLVINVGEMDQAQFTEANPNGVSYGSRRGLTLARGGSAQLLQASPNQLADAAMKRKEEQAAAIGARFIIQGTGRETAEAARIRYGSQNSSLYIITTNVSAALEQCLKWVCVYQGSIDTNVTFTLTDQFYDETADPNLLVQQMLMLDKGIITKQDIRDYGRKTGFIEDSRTDEELDAEATPAPIDTTSVSSAVAKP